MSWRKGNSYAVTKKPLEKFPKVLEKKHFMVRQVLDGVISKVLAKIKVEEEEARRVEEERQIILKALREEEEKIRREMERFFVEAHLPPRR